MISIGRNEELLAKLTDTLTLLDGEVQSIIQRFDASRAPVIDIYITLKHDKVRRTVMLRFTGIQEFQFYGRKHNTVDFLGEYKFLQTEKGMYLSIDPYIRDGADVMDPEDQGFVLADDVEGYFLSHF